MSNGRQKGNYQRIIFLGHIIAFWLRVLADIGSLALAWKVGSLVVPDRVLWQIDIITIEQLPATFATAILTYYIIFKYFRLYEPTRYLGGIGDPLALFKACLLAFILTIVQLYLFKMFNISRYFLLIFFVSSMFFLHLFRYLIRSMGNHLHTLGYSNRRTLIIGDNETGRKLFRRLCNHPEEGWVPLGIVPIPGDTSVDDGIKRFKYSDRLRKYTRQGSVNEIILCLPEATPPVIFKYFKQVSGLPVTIRVLSKHFQILYEKLPLFTEEFDRLPVICFGGGRRSLWRLWVKRLIDILFSLSVLILGSPVWLWISLMIKGEDRGPALFSQERVRRIGKTFKLYKYRTMIIDAEKLKKKLEEQSFLNGPMFKIKDDPRITKIGKLLRKFSLDEIPQFINILKGEMSVVGPRPPLPEEVAEYEDWHKYRIEGWVGLTGLWQICGRNQLQFEEVVLFDVFYLHNFSLSLDFQIMLLTANVVLSPKGSY